MNIWISWRKNRPEIKHHNADRGVEIYEGIGKSLCEVRRTSRKRKELRNGYVHLLSVHYMERKYFKSYFHRSYDKHNQHTDSS
ncbi:hypothetical protein VNO77_00731 [Canavalia gladiata]|uniref:Uncharacterized protein n=1 Tax=Canavalia gladiata TaxID=3824 RepID=A0AAN9MV94_CANGL